MAQEKQKSQAQKTAASRQGKKTAASNKASKVKKNNPIPAEPEFHFPVRLISSTVCIGAFLVFLFMFLTPEDGSWLRLLRYFVQGIIGEVGFYVSIPALLYLFVIQAFSAGKPIKMRTICLISFVIICGSFSQLFMDESILPEGFAVLSGLYQSGAEGLSAGLLCGGLGLLLKLGPGKWLSIIGLIVGGVLTLLAAFQITLPSIVRAVQNRPRADWEDEEPEERQEPAAVVVNHLANKRIEYIEQKRQRQAELEQMEIEDLEPVEEAPAKPKKTVKKAEPAAVEMMRQIDSDVSAPVAAADKTSSAVPHEDIEILTAEVVQSAAAKAAPAQKEMPPLEFENPVIEEIPEDEPKPIVKPEKVTASDAAESAALVAEEIAKAQAVETPKYCFPPIDVLGIPSRGMLDATKEMRENSRRLSETLESFKIEAHIINVTRGPSVTRYEVELDKGVRLNKLTTCADDIALSLGASGVRIAAIPGKISVVGIEVPNRTVTTVSLREVIDSNEFIRAKSKSSFAVGKDIGGSCIVGNIAKLPHMLIAGTTGSGKSVCMNSIIISLLYKASPEDVKLIMVDPKMVELGIYNGIPHLLIPVVTDPKKAAGSLQWAVTEMMRRYKAMSDAGVRDLESYNSIVESQEYDGKKLPQIVVIIDELADLMLVAAKEVEESICRIAQMGRAAGIHLIIATQRPSADVITGLMKANIPSRIAFAVASAMESRIILDTQGAEKLVGRGDMLYAPIGNGKPLRVQGCFVSDEEVEAVASYVKENYNTSYDQEVMEEIERKAIQTEKKTETASSVEPNAEELDGDEMLPAAVDVILESGQASVSMLQRRLKLGYARAARIVDEMEEKGIVGPFQGSKPRAILITKEQWEQMKNGETSSQMNFDDLEDPDNF